MAKQKWLENLEQVAHGAMGFGLRLFAADYVWFWRERRKQWPPGDPITVSGKVYFPADRVVDMMNDIRSYVIGGTVVQVCVYGILIYLLVTK